MEGGVKVTLLLTRARPRVGVAERERERRRGALFNSMNPIIQTHKSGGVEVAHMSRGVGCGGVGCGRGGSDQQDTSVVDSDSSARGGEAHN